jgi:hypothetical protein
VVTGVANSGSDRVCRLLARGSRDDNVTTRRGRIESGGCGKGVERIHEMRRRQDMGTLSNTPAQETIALVD